MSELDIAINAAVKTVDLIRKNYIQNAGIISQKGKDIKTKADFAANDVLIRELNKTGIKIVSEESCSSDFSFKECQWIIDPIDGTLNFSRGYKEASVSISLWNEGRPLLGVINQIFDDNLFTSLSGKGAWLNGEKINVSAVSIKNKAIIATVFPSGAVLSDDLINKHVSYAKKFKKVRMIGCASLMLAYVASGVFDIYEEDNIYIWDVAAGLSLVYEAGGCYNITPGSTEIQFNISAGNKLLIKQN